MFRNGTTKILPGRYGFYCGVDEVGRGAIAGPIVAAAVIMPRGWYPTDLDDSKKLSKSKRMKLHDIMWKRVHCQVGVVSPKEIDEINVHNASLLAMSRAIEGLRILPSTTLIDGAYVPKDLKSFSQAIISGDSLVPAIAASSIFAKVYRDNLMASLSKISVTSLVIVLSSLTIVCLSSVIVSSTSTSSSVVSSK